MGDGIDPNGDPLYAPDVSPELLIDSMPEDIKQAFPSFGWSEEGLWSLDLPVEEFTVDRFSWLLDLPIWRWQGRRWQVSMRDVLNDAGRYRAHHEKAEQTNTRYPIHASFHNGRWVILDGYHRLLKTLTHGESTIPVVSVRAEDLDQ